MDIVTWKMSEGTQLYCVKLRNLLDEAVHEMVVMPNTGSPPNHASDLERISMRIKIYSDLLENLTGDPITLHKWLKK